MQSVMLSRRGRSARRATAAVAGIAALTAPCGFAHADRTALPAAPGEVGVSVDAATGTYTITQTTPVAWTFSGTTGAPLTSVATVNSRDNLGAYHALRFEWTGPDGPRTGTIVRYDGKPAVQFFETANAATNGPWTNAFPAFTSFPPSLHPFSYVDNVFAPPNFGLSRNATPYVLFDDQRNTAILAPTTDLFLSRMSGETTATATMPANLTSGLNAAATALPAGFTHGTILYLGQGIRDTFHAWGEAYTALAGRKRPASDAELTLKYLGYWTDNGADYYYNYDLDRGYAQTLIDLVGRYRDEKIPIHYLQLDSWWYQKTFTSPNGKSEGKTKNAKLPAGNWNAYGGTLVYRASPVLFPNGLADFHKKVDLPLVVHARWIDRTSPYHKDYRISGVAPIDPKWWDETAAYLKDSGVIEYEQDWLNEIYTNSPEMGSTPGVGNAFADNMARSAKENGQNLQYCMALPRYFLNGARYDNLTTIRVSGDRFERGKYDNFLYTSALADAMGIWPWVDVFKSTERDNLLLATLSAGPVGTGDLMGKESRDDLLHAVRADGRIVKPDAPITPADESFLADARREHAPLLGWTYTDHASGPRTVYAFAYRRRNDLATADTTLPLPGLGLHASRAYVYDAFAQTGKVVETNTAPPATLSASGDGYWIVAPVGPSKIALLGDLNHFASMGKMRIPAVAENTKSLVVTLALTPDEKTRLITGWCAQAPKLGRTEGGIAKLDYDAATNRFAVGVEPNSRARTQDLDGDPVRLVTVTLSAP